MAAAKPKPEAVRSSKHRSPWALLRQSWRDYRANWRLVGGVTLLVALPVAILSSLGAGSTGDSTISAYIAFIQLAMNVAVIYLVIKIVTGGSTTIREAYYEGSAMLVRLVLVSLLVVLMLLPLLLGLVIISVGVLAPGAGLNTIEQLLLLLLAIVLAVPSVLLVVRGLWAAYIIFEGPDGPIQAVNRSRQLTKGKVLLTLGRLLALLGLLIGILVIPAVALVLLGDLTGWAVFGIILQVIITLVVLPLGNFYLYRYYRELA